MNEDKDPIRAACQQCGEIIRAKSERATGLLLALHYFDYHASHFRDIYKRASQANGHVVRGQRIRGEDLSMSLTCECDNTTFQVMQTKEGFVFEAICQECGESIDIN